MLEYLINQDVELTSSAGKVGGQWGGVLRGMGHSSP